MIASSERSFTLFGHGVGTLCCFQFNLNANCWISELKTFLTEIRLWLLNATSRFKTRPNVHCTRYTWLGPRSDFGSPAFWTLRWIIGAELGALWGWCISFCGLSTLKCDLWNGMLCMLTCKKWIKVLHSWRRRARLLPIYIPHVWKYNWLSFKMYLGNFQRDHSGFFLKLRVRSDQASASTASLAMTPGMSGSHFWASESRQIKINKVHLDADARSEQALRYFLEYNIYEHGWKSFYRHKTSDAKGTLHRIHFTAKQSNYQVVRKDTEKYYSTAFWNVFKNPVKTHKTV